MKKVAVTVAVLALGLAACAQNTDTNNAAANDLAVENETSADMNMGMDATNAADNALENAGNAVEDAGNAVENAGDAVANAAENATE
ncbi:MAG TPA: circumsporozoite protein [Sphingomicrobium sp.]|nr:circumsporozoite protein [Sphingomicrobium sp.]